ncbi:MAG: hypothetical protein AAF664_13100 [Planctomycetota bacterium]
MNFAILGILVVALFAFGFFVFKAATNWRWYQILPLVITMILVMTIMFPTAGVLKSRQAWHKIKNDLEKQANQVDREYRELKYGDGTTIGVDALATQVSGLTLEAGRAWRNLQNAGGTPKSITLSAPPDYVPIEAPAGEDGEAAGQLPLIPEGLTVYGFAEALDPQTGIAIPGKYLGEYSVTGTSPTQVTIAPTTTQEPDQIAAIESGEAVQWSLYELLPLDGHQVFLAEGSGQSEDNVLGRVDEEKVRELLGDNVPEEVLQSYLEDGRRQQQGDPPLARWTLVEFTKNYAIDVDSPDQRGALDGGFFDQNGRAVDARLQAGDDGRVKFSKGEQILVKSGEASKKIIEEDEAAKLVGEYYLRPLNDYRYILRRIRLRLTQLDTDFNSLQKEKVLLDATKTANDARSVELRDAQVRLEADLAQHQKESAAINQHVEELTGIVNEMRSEMARLYKANLALEEKLERAHYAVEQQVAGLAAAK